MNDILLALIGPIAAVIAVGSLFMLMVDEPA